MNKADSILKEVLKNIEPSREEKLLIENSLKEFVSKIKKNFSHEKNKPEIFVGGSYAKKTVIKKGKYDIDIFLRYGKEYNEKDISKKTKTLLKSFKGVSVVHGSRDYYRIKINDVLFIELVPVMKVSSPEDTKNITDLSYSHVKYINKKVKNNKILNDIKIAKAFCHANRCYGAESYIKGFSGYSLELLVYYYNGFMKMIKALSKGVKKENKMIIDIEKDYKNKKDVLMDMNSSKLESPVILVDPTYPQRNALAALSYETYEIFREACLKFIKNPSLKSFEPKRVNVENAKEEALRKKNEFVLLNIFTNKQEGDIAGSKLLKFYNHLSEEISVFYNIKNKGFEYDDKKSAVCFYAAASKKEIIYNGPFTGDIKNEEKFRKEHKNVVVIDKRLYAKEKYDVKLKDFLEKWKIKNQRKIKEMSINKIEIIDF